MRQRESTPFYAQTRETGREKARLPPPMAETNVQNAFFFAGRDKFQQLFDPTVQPGDISAASVVALTAVHF